MKDECNEQYHYHVRKGLEGANFRVEEPNLSFED